MNLRVIENELQRAYEHTQRTLEKPEKPMPLATDLYTAFALTTEEARHVLPPSEIGLQTHRSITAGMVAEIFADMEQAVVGIAVDDRRLLRNLPEMARNRCVSAAQLGVKVLDPDFRVRVADEAVTRYMAEAFDGIVPTETEQRLELERARKIIGLFVQAEREEL